MEKHPALRLRRTLEPAPPGRAIWGVARGAAREALQLQEQESAAARQELDAQTMAVRTEVERLTAQIAQQKRRLESLRHIVSVLRDKLAHERAARAVLAARLLDRQNEAQKQQEAAAAGRLEAARLSADVAQEQEALKQLVAALYRSISGRAGVPAGLDVLAELPPPPAGGPRPILRPTAPWQRFLAGKKAGAVLQTADGRIILRAGETIGPDDIAAAEQAGLLFELILTMKTAERIPEL